MPAKIVLSGISPMLTGLNWESASQMRIGRHPGGDIVLSDASVAQHQAEVYVSLQGWMIRDLGSNKSLVNGVPVGNKARRLQREDVLQFGNLLLKVKEATEEQRPVTPSPRQSTDIKTTGPLVRVEASSQRSWEEGLCQFDVNNPNLAHKQFLTLLRGGYPFSRIDNLDELLQALLEDTLAVFNARRGAVLLLDDAGKLMLRAAAQRNESNRPHRCYSVTLAERCFYQAQSLLCANVHKQIDLRLSDSAMNGDMASIVCAFLRSPRRRLGVLHLDRGPLDEPFTQESLSLADSVAATIAMPIEAALEVEKQWQQLAGEAMALADMALRLHEPAVVEHSRRVAEIAGQLAEGRNLSRRERHEVRLAALVHEIGVNEGLASIVPVVCHMYERWDGTGLPDGLAGAAIPLTARVLALAHAAAELTAANRKPSLPWPDALTRLQKQAGSIYDPECVALLCSSEPGAATARK